MIYTSIMLYFVLSVVVSCVLPKNVDTLVS
jgi:hypothetical protein